MFVEKIYTMSEIKQGVKRPERNFDNEEEREEFMNNMIAIKVFGIMLREQNAKYLGPLSVANLTAVNTILNKKASKTKNIEFWKARYEENILPQMLINYMTKYAIPLNVRHKDFISEESWLAWQEIMTENFKARKEAQWNSLVNWYFNKLAKYTDVTTSPFYIFVAYLIVHTMGLFPIFGDWGWGYGSRDQEMRFMMKRDSHLLVATMEFVERRGEAQIITKLTVTDMQSGTELQIGSWPEDLKYLVKTSRGENDLKGIKNPDPVFLREDRTKFNEDNHEKDLEMYTLGGPYATFFIAGALAQGWRFNPLQVEEYIPEELKSCITCGESNHTLKMCSACNGAVYCSEECQAQDWDNKHKYECRNK